MHVKQVGDELADQFVAADLFGGYLLGFAQRGDGLGDLAALRVSAGNVDDHPGAPFGGQPAGVHGGGGPQGPARITEFDGDRDLIQADVGGTELSVVVVASLAKLPGDLAGPLKMAVGGAGVVDAGRR